MKSFLVDESFIQEMGLDESYRKESIQAACIENEKDYKRAGDQYNFIGKIVLEEANTWKDIASDMPYDECQRAIINLSTFYYDKAKEFFSKSFNDFCFYGASQGNALSISYLAKSYSKGQNAISKDPIKAISLFKKAAEQGIVSSMYELGKCYFEGLLVEKDLNEAFKWLLLAARRENRSALAIIEKYYEDDWGKNLFMKEDEKGDLSYRLGNWHLNSGNFRKGRDFLFMAADLGSVVAMRELAYHFLLCNKPLFRDLHKAIVYYSQAAEKGDNISMSMLGYCYFEGLGVDKNLIEACAWFKRAIENGNINALVDLGICYKDGLGLSIDHAKALDLFMKADEKGNPRASYQLGYCYLNGIGAHRDSLKALHYYVKAAKNGIKEAMRDLGELYAEAENAFIENEIEQTFVSFQNEANKGKKDAIYLLALCFEYGVGVKKYISEATLLYWEAVKKGHQEADHRLKHVEWMTKKDADKLYMSGCSFKHGIDVIEDHRQAALCFLEAARKGNVSAMYELGILYESGDGVTEDKKEAFNWYKQAGKNGHSKALKKLKNFDHISSHVEENEETDSEKTDTHSLEALEKRVKIAEFKVLALLKGLEKQKSDRPELI